MRAVITYHSVDESGSVISVSRSELARQLDHIASSSARISWIDDIATAEDDVDAIAITFDDGFQNFAEDAEPLLAERGLCATVFVVPDFAGGFNDWEDADSRAEVPRLPLMSWETMRLLDPRKVRIGAHGLTHRSLKGLEKADIASELSACVARIESNIATRPRTLAYPYGDYDLAAVDAARPHFAIACTTRFALIESPGSLHEVPRLDSWYFRGNDMLRRFGTREFHAWVALRRTARTARQKIRRMRNG